MVSDFIEHLIYRIRARRIQTSPATASYYVKKKRDDQETTIVKSEEEIPDPKGKGKRHRRMLSMESALSSTSTKVIKEHVEGMIPFSLLIEYVPGVTVVRSFPMQLYQ
jgi:hypothetical protein